MLERDRARAATLGVDMRPAEASAPGRRPGASTGRRSRSPSGALHTLAGGLPVVIAAGLVTVLLTRATSLTEARPQHTGGRSATSSASSPSATGGRLSGTGAMDLRRRGELPHTEIATVSTSDDLLWRTAVLTSYRGGLWRPTSAALDDGAGGAGGATAGPEVRHRTDMVTVLDGAEGVLPVPGDIDGLVPHAVARLGDGLTLSVPAGTFQVSSHTAALAGARFGPASGSGADARLTALPPMPGRVAALAQRLTAGTTSQDDAVEAVVRYLRENYRYRLDPPVPSQGEDPVDRFLFEDREGFCEQFAAAAAVLLRSVGIPVRVAVGYAGGTPVDGGRLLRGTDGHAWIEVLTPGSGWAPVDPTAGVPLAPTSSALTAWLGRPGTRAVLLAGAGLAASVLLGAVAGRLSRRRIEHGLDPLDRALAALDRRLGPRRRRRDETLREFADRLGLEPEQQAALQVAEQARYSAVQPDANRRLDAAMALRSAARRGGR
ncbi:MAG: protein-glutamine gamma-glutamyltransferase, partial [Frankiaceae bacterium]|nr:protein-glutamine gamma-glutamyltransferase [Frankiaceae bacterium]